MTRRDLVETLRHSKFWKEDRGIEFEKFDNIESDVSIHLELSTFYIICPGVFTMSINYNEVKYDYETGALNIRKRGSILI